MFDEYDAQVERSNPKLISGLKDLVAEVDSPHRMKTWKASGNKMLRVHQRPVQNHKSGRSTVGTLQQTFNGEPALTPGRNTEY